MYINDCTGEHFIIIFPRTFISIVVSSVFDSHIFPIAFGVSCDFLQTFTLHLTNLNILLDGSVSNVLDHSTAFTAAGAVPSLPDHYRVTHEALLATT